MNKADEKGEDDMASVVERIALPISPDHVWKLIGGFGSLPDWLPFISSLELHDGGRIRRFSTVEGAQFSERLIRFDQAKRSYTYELVEAPIPVGTYRSTLGVTQSDADSGSVVEWSGEFKPVGVTEAEAVSVVSGIYRNGLKSLAQQFGVGRSSEAADIELRTAN
ncbi:SRPBCC family protein [Rhizobium sp. 768_B6_N1_8]|uniref:SRPBCC family protein n=1 Tax=unclassified Rhizobium TaxID=2613769 RepID=UPI003F21948E